MSIGFLAFGKIVFVTMPIMVELSIRIVVGSCECPISVSVAFIATACLALIKWVPNLELVADDMMV